MEEGLTAVMARTEAQSLVPEAGESDFQTGMCLRAGRLRGRGELREVQDLLLAAEQHGAKYGFIFRYPEGKESYTGCTADPSVIRYVGSAAAAAMQQRSMCLEEYIDYLASQG